MNLPTVQRWWRQVFAMIQKEWKQLLRDRALFGYVIFIFTIDILIAAGAPELDLKGARLGVIDRDNSTLSRELMHRLRPPQFDVYHLPDEPATIQRQLDRGDFRAILTIPHGFEKAVMRGTKPAVQLLVDASDANLGYLAASYTERILQPLAGEFIQRRIESSGAATTWPEVRLAARARFNPSLIEAWYTTISELLTMITVAAILLPAAALVREKERGTIEQLLVSPLTPLQIVLAKILAMTTIILIGTSVSVGLIMNQIVGVPFVGNVGLFFAMVALYAGTASGLGVLASTFARNSGQVGLIVLLLVMPIIMLSGTWNLRESMPDWLQMLVSLSPLRYFVDIAYGVLLKGSGIDVVAPLALSMALLGVLFLVLGVLRFRVQFR